MRKIWKVIGTAMCVAAAMSLCGCGGVGGQTQQTDTTNARQQQLLLCYNYGTDDYDGSVRVFNNAGKLIAKTGANIDGQSYHDAWIVTDDQNRQTGVALITREYSEDEVYEWGSPVITAVNYSFIDLNGNETANVTINDIDEINFMAPDGVNGDIIFFRFVDNDTAEDGVARYEVYNKMGEKVLSNPLPTSIQNVESQYAYAYYNGELLIINHEAWNSSWTTNELHCYAFDKMEDGAFAPKKLDKDYYSISRVYQNDGTESAYWQAKYYPVPGAAVYDVLADDGSVQIEGLNYILAGGNGLIFAQRGDERVLLNMDGEVLYRESRFAGLDD